MIDVSKLDPNFKYEIMKEPGGEHVTRCFACGTCTATCPVREMNDEYNPRRIIRMAILGMRQEVLTSDFIWLCASCYTCEERCPQDVKIPGLMNAIKNIAVRQGHIHPSFRAQLEVLFAHGRLYEITEFDNKKRAKWGLPEIRENVEGIRKLFRKTGMEKLVKNEGGAE